MTQVVNIHNATCDVYIGRAGSGESGYFGNPYKEGSREQNIALFRSYFLDRLSWDLEFRCRVLALRGKKLGCFCKPLPCHGDVIKEWLDGLEDGLL